MLQRLKIFWFVFSGWRRTILKISNSHGFVTILCFQAKGIFVFTREPGLGNKILDFYKIII